MKDCPAGIFVETAQAGVLFAMGRDGAEVVGLLPAVDFFLGERDAEVAIEIAAAGRDPGEAPAHPLLECHEFLERARETSTSETSRGQMLDRAIHVIHHVGAARATLFPIGPEHEVIGGQLAPAVEQIGQAQFALRAGEGVAPFRPGPGKFAAPASELVAQARQLLFLGQEFAGIALAIRCWKQLGGRGGRGIHEKMLPWREIVMAVVTECSTVYFLRWAELRSARLRDLVDPMVPALGHALDDDRAE